MTQHGQSVSEVCRGCGFGAATSDGYCLNCVAAEFEYDEDDVECTHCGGSGDCYDGADPLGDCGDEIHNCHACGGSGRGKDQVIF